MSGEAGLASKRLVLVGVVGITKVLQLEGSSDERARAG